MLAGASQQDQLEYILGYVHTGLGIGFVSHPQAQLNPKKKIFEELSVSLKTDGSGQAQFAGVPFMTSAGPVTSTVPNASVK